jgi:hypothetical protein
MIQFCLMDKKAIAAIVLAGSLAGEALLPEKPCDLAAPPQSPRHCESPPAAKPHIEAERPQLQTSLGPGGGLPPATSLRITQIS